MSRAAKVGLATTLGAALAIPGCQGAKESHPLYGTVAHTQDQKGHPIGVRVYAGPNSDQLTNTYREGVQVTIICRTLGRTVLNADVPNAGGFALEFSEWLRIATPPDRPQQWVGRPYLSLVGVDPPVCQSDQIPK